MPDIAPACSDFRLVEGTGNTGKPTHTVEKFRKIHGLCECHQFLVTVVYGDVFHSGKHLRIPLVRFAREDKIHIGFAVVLNETD